MITANKDGHGVDIAISGKIAADLVAGDVPMETIKGARTLCILIDANITNESAARLLHNLLARQEAASLANIVSARGLALFVAAAADAVTVADNAEIVFGNLPKEDTTRDLIVSRLANRLGIDAATITRWFATGKRMSAAEASALFARPHGLNAKALLDRDGGLSPEKIMARWNAPKG